VEEQANKKQERWMVISSTKHKIPTHVYSPFIFVLSKNVFCQGVIVLINPVCVLLSAECFMFMRATYMLQFLRLDDLQNIGFDLLKIVLFGPVFLKLREARRKETFHTITDLTLSHVLSRNSK